MKVRLCRGFTLTPISGDQGARKSKRKPRGLPYVVGGARVDTDIHEHIPLRGDTSDRLIVRES